MEEGTPSQIFTLPLETLLTILQGHQQSAELQEAFELQTETLLAKNLVKLLNRPRGERISIRVHIARGQVQTCEMRSVPSRQVLLTGQQALEQCLHWEGLDWQVRRLTSPVSPPPPSGQHRRLQDFLPLKTRSWMTRLPPRWVQPPGPEQLATLTHRQRQVLVSVNGQRSVNDLSQLLQCHPKALNTLLDQLEAKGLITSDPHHLS